MTETHNFKVATAYKPAQKTRNSLPVTKKRFLMKGSDENLLRKKVDENLLQTCVHRVVARTLIGEGGGGGVYSYIHVLPD